MNATQIVLIVFIVALIIIYPIMIVSRNKKENARMQEQTNSLKRGDKVLLTSGVYGEVVDMHEENGKTIITLETGKGNHKGYLSVDAYAVYTILKDEEPATEEQKTEEPAVVEEKPEAEETAVEEPKEVSETEQTEKTNKKGKK